MGIKVILLALAIILSQIFSGYTIDYGKYINATAPSISSIKDFLSSESKDLLDVFIEEPKDNDQSKEIKEVITSFQKELHDSKEERLDLAFEDHELYLTSKAQTNLTKNPYFLDLVKQQSHFVSIEFKTVLIDVNNINTAVAEYTVHYEIMDRQGHVREKGSTSFINRLAKIHHHWQIDAIKIQT